MEGGRRRERGGRKEGREEGGGRKEGREQGGGRKGEREGGREKGGRRVGRKVRRYLTNILFTYTTQRLHTHTHCTPCLNGRVITTHIKAKPWRISIEVVENPGEEV